MDCNFRKDSVQGFSASPPSEAWLVGQALLGKPIPNPFRAQAEARAERKNLEWLARLLPRYADELRKLQFAEAEARHERKMLEWMAQFSTRHADELRTLLREEAAAREAQTRWGRFYEAYIAREAQWNPADHPRAPKGQPDGGQWVDKDGGGGSGAAGPPTNKPDPSGEDGYQRGADGHRVPTDMLELAHAWWQTNRLLQQSRHDMETLPARIASEYAKLNSGDGYSHIHAQNIAKAQRDLAKAKELAPQLDTQQRDLEQQYHDSGYDQIPYSTWTPGETFVVGRGIAEVGRAVHMGGSPAGLKPTGIEFDVATAAMAGPAILRLGKALLRKALSKAPVPVPRAASFGQATSSNYRKTFFDANPGQEGKVVVHHAVEQQALKQYPGVVTESELHSLENLRGVPKGSNSETHLRAIRKEWNLFYDKHSFATKEELLDKATELDNKYGHLFDPPIR